MKTRLCIKCKVDKPYNLMKPETKCVDGVGTVCIDCHNSYQREKRKICPELHRKYEKDYRDRNRNEVTARRKLYVHENKEKISSYNKSWELKNKHKSKAKSKVNYMVRKGYPKANTRSCRMCDKTAAIYHHHNYDLPYNVTPLCKPCHSHVHGNDISTESISEYVKM